MPAKFGRVRSFFKINLGNMCVNGIKGKEWKDIQIVKDLLRCLNMIHVDAINHFREGIEGVLARHALKITCFTIICMRDVPFQEFDTILLFRKHKTLLCRTFP
jgi:hypothetical protein